MESQVKATRTNPVVIKTHGTISSDTSVHIQEVETEDGVEEDEESAEHIAVLGNAPLVEHSSETRTGVGRLANKLCYVCKMEVGPIHKLRIGKHTYFQTHILTNL